MDIRRAMKNPVSTLLLLGSLVGCGTMHSMPCGGDGRFAVPELVYFGTETPSGHITPEARAQFLREIVTPEFS
jgi:hypothetical protein